MPVEHVAGKKKGDVLLYALSTCVWCKKTKALLNDLGVDYQYIFVDQVVDEKEKKAIQKAMEKWNPDGSFPTLVIDQDACIVGYKPEEVKKRLGS